jgi:hypothetical protein
MERRRKAGKITLANSLAGKKTFLIYIHSIILGSEIFPCRFRGTLDSGRYEGKKEAIKPTLSNQEVVQIPGGMEGGQKAGNITLADSQAGTKSSKLSRVVVRGTQNFGRYAGAKGATKQPCRS